MEEEEEEEMGILYDDVVLLNHSEREGEPSVMTVNCPDKTGLGSDLCRIILFFGVTIVRVGMCLNSLFLSFVFLKSFNCSEVFVFV